GPGSDGIGPRSRDAGHDRTAFRDRRPDADQELPRTARTTTIPMTAPTSLRPSRTSCPATASRVAVFHSLRFPGSTRADIDHAVLIGHELFLVDSKAWRGGAYRQESVDTIVASGGQDRHVSVPAASAAVGGSGCGDVRVVPVMHASSGRVRVTSTVMSCHMVGSPGDMVEMLLGARGR